MLINLNDDQAMVQCESRGSSQLFAYILLKTNISVKNYVHRFKGQGVLSNR